MKERKFNKDIYMNYSLSLKIDERKTVITSLNNSQNKIEKLIEYKSFLQKILGYIYFFIKYLIKIKLIFFIKLIYFIIIFIFIFFFFNFFFKFFEFPMFY